MSLLAIQIKDMAHLGEQLGGERLQRLQRQLAQAIQQRVRTEDALISWQRGYLVLCLAGTDAAGATGLAGRLSEWFTATRFSLDTFSLELQTAMAVHVADHDGDGARESVRELLMDTLCLLAAEDGEGPSLSKRARQQRSTASGEPINGDRRGGGESTETHHGDPQQLTHLLDKLGDDRNILVRALSPALQRLDESTRLLLVDHLLEASLMPTPVGSH